MRDAYCGHKNPKCPHTNTTYFFFIIDNKNIYIFNIIDIYWKEEKKEAPTDPHLEFLEFWKLKIYIFLIGFPSSFPPFLWISSPHHCFQVWHDVVAPKLQISEIGRMFVVFFVFYKSIQSIHIYIYNLNKLIYINQISCNLWLPRERNIFFVMTPYSWSKNIIHLGDILWSAIYMVIAVVLI